MGPALTGRDAVAADIAPILSRATPRPPEEWPTVTARPVGLLAKLGEALEWPLTRVEKDLVGEALAHEARATGMRPAADAEGLSRTEARTHLHRIQGRWFPGVANGRKA